MSEKYRAGSQVRLKSDPGHQGILTGKQRPRSGTVMYQVSFAEGKSYQPEYEIEVIADDNSDPYALLQDKRFGRVTDLRRNLLHIQLSGRLANLVYSMETTNTDFYAYQFKPVLSFLESPSNGILIADEVGLGKTIEAGLIWTELRARYDSRRLVVVCPAMLREKWRDELRNRFGVDADIMDAGGLLKDLRRNRNDIADGKGVICSMQGLRPPRNWWGDEVNPGNSREALARYLDEQIESEPPIDLLIVDEAHYMRNPDSQTAKLGRMLRNASEHVVLLSATPINLRSDDLYHLLNIVDPDSFDVKEVFPQVLAANEPLNKARELALDMRANAAEIEDLLREARQHSLLASNLQLEDLVEKGITPEILNQRAGRIHLANRIERINLLRHAVNRTRKAEVNELRVIRDPKTEFVNLSEAEWNFYMDTSQAIREYAAQSDINAGFLLASPQRQVSSCMYAAALSWQKRQKISDQLVYEDLGLIREKKKDISPLIDHLASKVLPSVDLVGLRENDSKYDRFRRVLLEYLKANPKEKIVVFSYFRGTLSYLSQRLSENGVKNQVLVGGMRQSKQDVIDAFRDDVDVRILLSSEVASEGVDLQFCRVLVNYDLPWNPMKIEQRIGRIDRIGQKSEKINIWNLCYANTIDQRIHERLFQRLDIFRRALGGLDAILGDQIESLSIDLLSKELTEEEQNQRIDQTATAVENNRQTEEKLEKQASHLIAHGGYILEQVQAAHKFKKRITEIDLVAYVKDYLNRYCQGHEFRQPKSEELDFVIRLPTKTAASLQEFIQSKKLHAQTQLATGEEIHCKFANKVARSRNRVELISQFHPLIRFISQDLRRRNEAFYPLVAASLSQELAAGVSPGTYAFAINRWTFSGLGVEEELRARAILVDDNDMKDPDISLDLVNSTRVNGQDWLSVGSELDLDIIERTIDECAVRLEQDFSDTSRERKTENADRVSFQIESAIRGRDRQLKTHYEVLEKLELAGNERMIPARKGLIKKVKQRFDIQVEKLERKSKLGCAQFEVCIGVVSVQ